MYNDSILDLHNINVINKKIIQLHNTETLEDRYNIVLKEYQSNCCPDVIIIILGHGRLSVLLKIYVLIAP